MPKESRWSTVKWQLLKKVILGAWRREKERGAVLDFLLSGADAEKMVLPFGPVEVAATPREMHVRHQSRWSDGHVPVMYLHYGRWSGGEPAFRSQRIADLLGVSEKGERDWSNIVG